VASLYEITVAPTGYASLDAVRDRKLRREIGRAIDGLERTPETQGKPLMGPLEGLRSLKAGRGRYRIIFEVDSDKKQVHILLIGERRAGQEKDIYAVAQKLLRSLLEEE
jgi:mRNA-degrading endonuclease RelE of RelBE toxin-antitoxin system